jgi:hypothetical protein
MRERLSKAAVNDGRVLDSGTPYQVYPIWKHHTKSSLLIDRILPHVTTLHVEQTSSKRRTNSWWCQAGFAHDLQSATSSHVDLAADKQLAVSFWLSDRPAICHAT